MDVVEKDQNLPKPVFTWEEGSYKLSEVTNKFPLPVVVQYDRNKHPVPFNQFNFDISQPLLLYKRRNIQKVPATSLSIQQDTYITVGESLLIPEDYKGWFAVLQRSCGNGSPANDFVPHFATVEELAGSNTDKFLIGGTTKIIGLQILERSESHLNHEQRPFMPGEVLSKGKIYYGETKKKSRLFRKPKYITEKFLMCRDDAEREILLPFTQKGIFYQISVISGKPNRNVMQMCDIVAKKYLPRVLKLVYGQFPITPCSFTGLMRAEQAKLESSIIAATMVNRKNILLELPIDTGMHFRVAQTTDDVKKNQCFLDAMKLCSEKATTYMRNIKVSMTFSNKEEPDNSNGDIAQHKTLINPEESGSNDAEQTKPNDSDRNGPSSCKSNPENDGYVSCNNSTSNAPPQEHIYMNTSQYVGEENEKEMAAIHLSEDYGSDIQMRPSRCLSVGHASICYGNSYLILPIYSHDHLPMQVQEKTGHNEDHNMRKPQEEDFSDSGVPDEESKDMSYNLDEADDDTVKLPPPKPCNLYFNIPTDPLQEEESPSVEDTANSYPQKRSSTKAPDVSPPPIPKSFDSYSSSSSVTSEDMPGKRTSSDSFEYDVPKLKSPAPIPAVRTTLLKAGTTGYNGAGRRPSTFTFTEGGGLGIPRNLKTGDSNRTSLQSVSSTEDGGEIEDGPVYANIAQLKELALDLDSNRSSFEDEQKQEDNIEEDTTESEENKQDHHGNAEESDIYEQLWDIEDPPVTSAKTVISENEGSSLVELKNEILDIKKGDSHKERADYSSAEECGYQSVTSTGEPLKTETETENMIKTSDNELNSDNSSKDFLRQTDMMKNKGNSFEGQNTEKERGFCVGSRHEKGLSLLSVEELGATLREIGLREETVDYIQYREIDGQALCTAESEEMTLSEFLPEVRLVDLKKLSMFIRGWRPQETQTSM